MKIIKNFKDFLNESSSNIFTNKHGYLTTNIPLIPDAIEIISKDKNAIEFEKFAESQNYFSASFSHCFYTEEEHKEWSKNGCKYIDKDSENSILLFQFGKIIQVWDEKNQIGYIIPSDKIRKWLLY